jgi:hypothetical protein
LGTGLFTLSISFPLSGTIWPCHTGKGEGEKLREVFSDQRTYTLLLFTIK